MNVSWVDGRNIRKHFNRLLKSSKSIEEFKNLCELFLMDNNFSIFIAFHKSTFEKNDGKDIFVIYYFENGISIINRKYKCYKIDSGTLNNAIRQNKIDSIINDL